jgi:hypothetical protein
VAVKITTSALTKELQGEEITPDHVIDTLKRIELMAAALRQAVEWMTRGYDAKKGTLKRSLGANAVLLAGLTRSGCRVDGSCARIRPQTATKGRARKGTQAK